MILDSLADTSNHCNNKENIACIATCIRIHQVHLKVHCCVQMMDTLLCMYVHDIVHVCLVHLQCMGEHGPDLPAQLKVPCWLTPH